MTLTYENVVQARQLMDELSKHIHDYLLALQKAESDIVCVDDDIASGGCDCFHYRPIPYFHDMQSYKPYVAMSLEYEIKEYTKSHVHVTLNENPRLVIKIPYTFSKKQFDAYCDELFDSARRTMARCKLVKANYLKEDRKYKAEVARIAGLHTHGDYTYRWAKCTRCSCGRVEVGTGKYEDDPWSYADSPREREIMRLAVCPDCKGTEGLLFYSKFGSSADKIVPCSRNHFIQHENDLFALLAD